MQDRIEMDVGTWIAVAANREEVNQIFNRIGPPPTVSKGSRLREDHGNAYGWLFNSMNLNSWQPKRKADVRMSKLEIKQNDGGRRSIPPPLFEGSCEWKIDESAAPTDEPEVPQESSETPGLETHERPVVIRGKLKLVLNPTRFFRHRFVARELPEGMQERHIPSSREHERSFDGTDNWLLLKGRSLSSLTSERWRQHVSRYFTAVEEAFGQELSRVCAPLQIHNERGDRDYNVKEVETYWEWFSPNPLKVVDDLVPLLRTFSRRFQGERTYEPLEQVNDEGLRILRIQTAPGEWLKIYAKTNLRIRIEVTHKFKKGKDRFQFPREADTQGNIRRTSAHTFDSLQGVQQFFSRLQTRAAHMVNQFLTHVSEHAEIVPSHICAYDALFKMARAIPNDYATAFSLLSLLLHEGGIPAGGDEAKQQAIDSLRAFGVIEPSGRRMYVPTAAYRHAFQTLRGHANFTLLTERVRTQNPSSTG